MRGGFDMDIDTLTFIFLCFNFCCYDNDENNAQPASHVE